METQTIWPGWIVARLGEDMNWWIDETSDNIYWPREGLGVMDPRQFRDILERIEEYRKLGFELATLAQGFCLFSIQAELPDQRLRLTAVRQPVEEGSKDLFAMPVFQDEDQSNYRELVETLVEYRVKLLNTTHQFAQPLDVLDLEEELLAKLNDRFFDGRNIHCYDELNEILSWSPASWDGNDEPPPLRHAEDPDAEEEEQQQ